MANAISNATPPQGVAVSKPHDSIEASAPAQIWFEIAISFGIGVTSSFVAAWLYDQLMKGPKKSGRVNHQQITFSNASIRRLIDKELAGQKRRDAQWAKQQKRPRKKS